jgi:DNA-binding beta-propeller fold protein YncE
VIVSPDGKRVYVASRSFPSAVAVFVRGGGGALRQPAGAAGCISQGGAAGCTAGRGLGTVWDIAASPDGRSIFAAGSESDSVAILRPTADGLSQAPGAAGCLARAAREGCGAGRALNQPLGLAVSPDGKTVYVASFESDAVAILRRNKSTGVITQAAGRAGCISQVGGGRCADGRALDGAQYVATSPDGRNLYVISYEVNAMGIFARNRADGTLKPLAGKWACLIRGGVLGCPSGRGLTGAVGLTVSPDGRNVYVGAEDSDLGAIGVYRRLR